MYKTKYRLGGMSAVNIVAIYSFAVLISVLSLIGISTTAHAAPVGVGGYDNSYGSSRVVIGKNYIVKSTKYSCPSTWKKSASSYAYPVKYYSDEPYAVGPADNGPGCYARITDVAYRPVKPISTATVYKKASVYDKVKAQCNGMRGYHWSTDNKTYGICKKDSGATSKPQQKDISTGSGCRQYKKGDRYFRYPDASLVKVQKDGCYRVTYMGKSDSGYKMYKFTLMTSPTPKSEAQKCKDDGGTWTTVNKFKAYCKYPANGKKMCDEKGHVWVETTNGGYCSPKLNRKGKCLENGGKWITDSTNGPHCIYPEPPTGLLKEECQNKLRRVWDNGTCKQVCAQKNYHIVKANPYNKCVKNPTTGGNPTPAPGPSDSDPTPKNKAKHNCTEVLHRVWKDGKCTAKCIDGYHVSKANPHKCVLHKNKGDKQPPTVKLTAPADSANVSDSLDYAATATDNVGVAEVTFYRSEEPVGSGTPQFSEVDSDDTKPYTASEDISDVTAGKYAVYAVATDTNGNTKKSQVVNVNIGEGSGNNSGGDILSGKCTKDFTVNRNLPRPDALKDEKLVGGIGFESTCPAAGDTAGVKITVLSSEYTVDELTVYRKTSAGEYSDVTADITAEDVDDASGDTTHVEITYVAKDGDDYDLNSVAAKLKNEVYITTDAEGGNDEENNNGGTTTTTNSNGSITTTGSNGTKTTTDANGNTYVNGQSTAKDKGSGALPNTGTSAFLGVLGVVAALVGAIVYRLAKKKGLHLPSDSQFLGNNNNQGV